MKTSKGPKTPQLVLLHATVCVNRGNKPVRRQLRYLEGETVRIQATVDDVKSWPILKPYPTTTLNRLNKPAINSRQFRHFVV